MTGLLVLAPLLRRWIRRLLPDDQWLRLLPLALHLRLALRTAARRHHGGRREWWTYGGSAARRRPPGNDGASTAPRTLAGPSAMTYML